MPQGLPKKIEVALLLPDLALELGDPPPRRRPLIEDRAPQRQPLQRPLARPTATSQRFQSSLANLLLPLVQPTPVDLQIRRHRRYLFASRNPANCPALQLNADILRTLHQFLS